MGALAGEGAGEGAREGVGDARPELPDGLQGVLAVRSGLVGEKDGGRFGELDHRPSRPVVVVAVCCQGLEVETQDRGGGGVGWVHGG